MTDSIDIDAVRKMADDAHPLNSLTVTTPDGISIPLASVFRGRDQGHVAFDLRAEADKWRTAPEHKRGVAKTLTLESFVELTNRHKDEDSAIFADIMSENPALVAVLDYHGVNARFGQHRIGYTFPLSDEWKIWRAAAAKELPQAVFAEFLEDHLHEMASPTEVEKATYEDVLAVDFGSPRDIMQLSRGLTINVETKVVNAQTLQNGAGQIVFEETHNGVDGKPLKVPGLFMIEIPLFFNGKPVRLPVRLRYKRAGGSINWTFLLYRAKEIVHDALLQDLADVGQETQLPIYEGSPEA